MLVFDLESIDQLHESTVLPHRIQKRVPLEPRVAGQTGRGGTLEPHHTRVHITKLSKRGAEAIGDMVIEI